MDDKELVDRVDLVLERQRPAVIDKKRKIADLKKFIIARRHGKLGQYYVEITSRPQAQINRLKYRNN